MTVKYEAQGRLHVALLHVALFPSGTADYIA